MERIAVFANDVDYAHQILQPMMSAESPTHWIVVACPPTLTRHIGRFVTHAAREHWRQRWAAELFDKLEPELKVHTGSRVDKMLAKRPLIELSRRLEAQHGALRLLDARRPRLGAPNEPISSRQTQHEGNRWAAPVALATGLSAVLALAD